MKRRQLNNADRIPPVQPAEPDNYVVLIAVLQWEDTVSHSTADKVPKVIYGKTAFPSE